MTAVALCTASSLALLGAVPAKWAMGKHAKRQAPSVTVVTAHAKPQAAAAAATIDDVLPQLAAFKTGELLEDVEVIDEAPVAAPAPAARGRASFEWK